MKKQSYIVIIFAAAAIVIAGLSCKTTGTSQSAGTTNANAAQTETSARVNASQTIAVITNSAANGQAGLPYYFVITNGELNRGSQFEEAWRGPDGRTLPRRRMGLSETFFVTGTDAQYVRGELCDGRAGYGPRSGAQIIPNMNTCVTIASQYFYPEGTLMSGHYQDKTIVVATNKFEIGQRGAIIKVLNFGGDSVLNFASSPSGRYWVLSIGSTTDEGWLIDFKKVVLVDTQTGQIKELTDLPNCFNLATYFMVGDDGKFIATGMATDDDPEFYHISYFDGSSIKTTYCNPRTKVYVEPFDTIITPTYWNIQDETVPITIDDERYIDLSMERISSDYAIYTNSNIYRRISRDLYDTGLFENYYINRLAVSPNNEWCIFSGDHDISICVYSLINNKLYNVFNLSGYLYIYDVSFDLNSNLICFTCLKIGRKSIVAIIYDLDGNLKYYQEKNIYNTVSNIYNYINVIPRINGFTISLMNEVKVYEIQ